MSNPYNPLEGERPEQKFNLQEKHSDERVSIIVIHNDRPEYLNICLQTVTVCSINSNYELIVVDNGSGQRSQDYLDQLESDGVKVIRNPENVWWAKAANQGAKAADKDSKYLVFMHHDVSILHPSWLDIMINVSQFYKSGLVGTNLRQYDMNNKKVPFIDESCMLVTRDCWKDVGPFEEDFKQEGASFFFTYKASKKGYNPQSVDQKTTPCVHHYQVFSMNWNEYERLNEQSQIIMPKMLAQLQ